MRLSNRILASSPRSFRVWLRFVALLIGSLGAVAPVPGDEHDVARLASTVSFKVRVVDLETEQPVRGASVVVERLITGILPSDSPRWAGWSTVVTDDTGRFVLNFPPEQVAERRLSISLGIGHADYIPRKSSAPLPLVEVLASLGRGEKPVFETIKLQKGVEYSGQVVTPGGKPAAGAAIELVQWGADGNLSDHFIDDTNGKTDLHGRFRIRMPRTHQLAIHVTPDSYAPFQQFWGANDPEQEPNIWAPTDLGQLVLAQGVRLSGRLIDIQGRPIAGQSIRAQAIYSRCERFTRTNADGRFTFASLRPGNYILLGQGQQSGGNYDVSARPVTTQGTVFEPTRVFLQEGIVPDCLVLRELPAVAVEVRFVDSQDRPVRGNFVVLWGTLPVPVNNQPVQQEAIFEGEGMASVINGPEHEDKSRNEQWAAQLVADASGRLVFHAPKGLRDAQIFTLPPNEIISISSRMGVGKPRKAGSGGSFDNLDGDVKGITFIYHHAPTIVATLKTEDGESPTTNIQINAQSSDEADQYSANFVEQPDGRYRTQNVVPDVEWEIAAWATGFVPNKVERVRPREGAVIDLTLTLRREPKTLAVGDFAPPFLVKTLDDGPIGLGDFRGKFVLLNFWSPADDTCIQELPQIKAVRDQFGKDGRVAMLGLCVIGDPREAVTFIKEKKITWPQAVLRDCTADSIVIGYHASELPKTFLIGPDGKVVARDLDGGTVLETVAKALGVK